MASHSPFPTNLQINAWAGAQAGNSSSVANDVRRFARDMELVKSPTLPAPRPDRRDWRHPDIGWGLVLPQDPALSRDDPRNAEIEDRFAPLRCLLQDRPGSPIFRVGANVPVGTIRRYDADGHCGGDLNIAASGFGTRSGSIPLYLMLVGSPTEVQWSIQYQLQSRHYVGRLDLEIDGLENYIRELISDWSDGNNNPKRSLFWCVDHGFNDITRMMKELVGQSILNRFASDTDASIQQGACFLTDESATGACLQHRIAALRPSLIVTTSHGQTGPLHDVEKMSRDLGLLVDQGKQPISAALFEHEAAPYGAIWFAQACCSAGSTSESAFVGLVNPGSKVDRILKAITACGDMAAPLPKALLGNRRPLRAFIGHVEPTFNWSLEEPTTSQSLAGPLQDCLYHGLFTGEPVGMALSSIRMAAQTFLNVADEAERSIHAKGDDRYYGQLLAAKLVARDWRSIVLFGDPTVRIHL